MTDGLAAPRRYKEVLAEISAAAAELRERDRARAAQIRGRLVDLEDEMLRAGTRARVTAAVAQLHWERALELLWGESWMKFRPRPGPDQWADPARLEEYEAEVDRCGAALRDAVRRRWQLRRR
jgi:hypothetical protein